MSVETCFAAALAVMAVGGCLALCLNRRPRIAAVAGCTSAIIGCVIAGGAAVVQCLPVIFCQSPIVMLGGVCSVFSLGYLHGHYETRSGIYWFFYNMTIAAMLAVTLATTPFTFLVCWEIMGLGILEKIIRKGVAYEVKNCFCRIRRG